MKKIMRTAAAVGLALTFAAGGALPAGAEELCPMGGVLIKVAVDTEKALEWFDDEVGPAEGQEGLAEEIRQETIIEDTASDRDCTDD